MVAPPQVPTVWDKLGITGAAARLRDGTLNRSGRFPGLEKKPPLLRIADPANLAEGKPEMIKSAAKIKQDQDLKKQKLKAIKFLADVNCGCYNKDGAVEKGLLAALEDCDPDVRQAGIDAISKTVGKCTCCRTGCEANCASEEIRKKLEDMACGMDEMGCCKEPVKEIRCAAAALLRRLPMDRTPPKPLEEIPAPPPSELEEIFPEPVKPPKVGMIQGVDPSRNPEQFAKLTAPFTLEDQEANQTLAPVISASQMKQSRERLVSACNVNYRDAGIGPGQSSKQSAKDPAETQADTEFDSGLNRDVFVGEDDSQEFSAPIVQQYEIVNAGQMERAKIVDRVIKKGELWIQMSDLYELNPGTEMVLVESSGRQHFARVHQVRGAVIILKLNHPQAIQQSIGSSLRVGIVQQ